MENFAGFRKRNSARRRLPGTWAVNGGPAIYGDWWARSLAGVWGLCLLLLLCMPQIKRAGTTRPGTVEINGPIRVQAGFFVMSFVHTAPMTGPWPLRTIKLTTAT